MENDQITFPILTPPILFSTLLFVCVLLSTSFFVSFCDALKGQTYHQSYIYIEILSNK